MNRLSADIVICGAGILGISAVYQLAVVRKQPNILLIDERPPLTLTSDKSTEAYRNWWPGPGDAVVHLLNRSITLMEEMARQTNNLFHLNRRGYLYVTTDSASLLSLRASAEEASALGAGELREHSSGSSYQAHRAEGFDGPDGADLLTDSAFILRHFPYLSKEVAAVLHVRRAGWLSGQIYGMWMLEQAKENGVQLLNGRVAGVTTANGRVIGVDLSDGTQIATSIIINAAGPHLSAIGNLLGVEIPVTNELHLKAAFNDHLGALGRDAPLVICADPQRLDWTEEERVMLAEDPNSAWLLDTLPSGAHTRPEGDAAAQSILVLWDLHNESVEATFPIPEDPLYAELAVRGLVRILPGFGAYLKRMPRPQIDGGYYTKTQENRPLACPLPIEGAYVIGAAAGYGIMAAAGLGELLAAHVVGDDLPDYAPMFDITRYSSPDYQRLLKNWGDSWQL
ncbi:MAG: FAD-binding oxidoreductase [Chloroflexi bacterium]|nr:FAD-binding oxidoreductase [Chloroflexota bacterium]